MPRSLGETQSFNAMLSKLPKGERVRQRLVRAAYDAGVLAGAVEDANNENEPGTIYDTAYRCGYAVGSNQI